MTIEQAANLLGVTLDATEKEINAAYRKKVAQYHPDANRNKSQSEQVQAEKMFKAVTAAKKLMLNPGSAKTSTTPQPQTRPQQTTTHQSQPRTTYTQPQQTTTSYSDPRTRYNKAKTFVDNVSHTKDVAEEQLSDLYETDASDIYKKGTDVFRFTPTLIMSLAFILWAAFSIVTNPTGLDSLSISNPFVILAGVFFFKALIYDLIASYFVYKLVNRYNFGWILVVGIDGIIFGVLAFIILNSMGVAVAPVALIFTVAGIIVAIVGAVLRNNPIKRTEQQY